MNHHQRLLPPGVNRALYPLSLLLLVATLGDLHAMPRLRRSKPPEVIRPIGGYLSIVGAPALRFQAATTAPVDLATNGPAPIASTPAPTAGATQPTVLPTVPMPAAPAATLSASAATGELPETPLKAEKTSAPKNKRGPAIIPDDTRQPLRPEDFLPYFQFPTSTTQNGALNVIVPVPREAPSGAPLSPSSATYTQTPK